MFDSLFTKFSYTAFGSWFNGCHHTLITAGQLIKSTLIMLVMECLCIYSDIVTSQSVIMSPYLKTIWLIILTVVEVWAFLEWIYAICRHIYYMKHYAHNNDHEDSGKE